MGQEIAGHTRQKCQMLPHQEAARDAQEGEIGDDGTGDQSAPQVTRGIGSGADQSELSELAKARKVLPKAMMETNYGLLRCACGRIS